MATGKRALIVDDSRSARVILSRMLEQHGMAVDTAESAEQALEYLQQSRPDVIFMDHLMPGMDGFQAVQAIKSDPQTAMIPLMMYTSQEGELYVSQARALGAIGVLPKTVRPVDVSRVLYQLRLLPERRTQRSALFDGSTALAAPGRGPMPLEASRAASASAAPAPNGPLRRLRRSPPRPAMTIPRRCSPKCRPACASRRSSWSRTSSASSAVSCSRRSRPLRAASAPRSRKASPRCRSRRSSSRSLPPPPARQWWPVALDRAAGLVPALVLGWLSWQALQANQQLSGELAKAQAAAGSQAQRRPAVRRCRSRPSHADGTAGGLQPTGAAGRRRAALRHRVRALRRDAARQRPARSPARPRRDARGAALQGTHSHRSIRRRLLPDRQRGRGYSSPTPTCRRRSATSSATRSRTRCRRRSTSRSISRTLPRRCASAPAAPSSSTWSTPDGAASWRTPSRARRRRPGEWNTVAAQNNRVEFRVIPAA